MQEPTRILFLFTILNRGGSETMVMNCYRHIDRTKVQFDFVVHREERGAYEDEIEQLGGRIYRFMPLRPWTIHQYKKQIKQFFDEHPEYRIVHGLCSELGYYFYKEASKRRIPVIIAHAQNSRAPYDFKWPWRTWFKYRMRPYLTHHLACSKDAARWLFGKGYYEQEIILPNAIDTLAFKFNAQARQRFRAKMNINDHTLVVGHVGRFDWQKNHKYIISVFKELHQQRPDSLLLLVGSNGAKEQDIRNLVQKYQLDKAVLFLGARTDIPELLSAMDIFVFPSHMEGIGIALVEAQCSGLPCIASNFIPKEANMTDLFFGLPIKRNKMNLWVDIINKQYGISRDRSIYAQQIKDAGYDIRQNAQWLQNFYLSCQR